MKMIYQYVKDMYYRKKLNRFSSEIVVKWKLLGSMQNIKLRN